MNYSYATVALLSILSLTSMSSSGVVTQYGNLYGNGSALYVEKSIPVNVAPRGKNIAASKKRIKSSSKSVTKGVSLGGLANRNIRSSTYVYDVGDTTSIPNYSYFEPYPVQKFKPSESVNKFSKHSPNNEASSGIHVSNWTTVGGSQNYVYSSQEHVPDQQRSNYISKKDSYVPMGHGLNYDHLNIHPGHVSHYPNPIPTEFEVEDKVFTKTVIATKALNAGKIVFVFFMVLIVFVISALGKLGLHLSPVVLPLALLPVGVIALILFIPLFVLFVPLAATGLAGEKKRSGSDFQFGALSPEQLYDLHDRFSQALNQIEAFQ